MIAEGVESIEQLMGDHGAAMSSKVVDWPMTAKGFFSGWMRLIPDPRWRLAGTDYPSNSGFHLFIGIRT